MATLTLEKNYQKDIIQEMLSNLAIEQTPDNRVLTTYQGRKISEVSVSNKYQLFDFPKFTFEMLDHIENFLVPSKATLTIKSGLQELALKGERFELNGETFFKQLCILSSSDKSRSLQMNVGLFRLICKNGAFVATDDALSFKIKHFKSLVPDALQHFTEKLPNFGIMIDSQINTIKELPNKTVTFSGVAEMILKTKDDEKEVASRIARLNSFSNKLLNSETDRLTDITTDQRLLLLKPAEFNTRATDIDIPADKVFNCYTEVYRTGDSSVIKRESKRILNIIDELSNN